MINCLQREMRENGLKEGAAESDFVRTLNFLSIKRRMKDAIWDEEYPVLRPLVGLMRLLLISSLISHLLQMTNHPLIKPQKFHVTQALFFNYTVSENLIHLTDEGKALYSILV